MSKARFSGGCHPYDGKALTMDKPVIQHKPAGDLVFPLSQHAGKPAEPIVKKGDVVLAGQLIAEAGGPISANIHSSVSGKVKAIQDMPLPTGGKGLSIVITNDNEYKEAEFIGADPETLSRDEIIAKIRAGGVVGLGGAGFPLDKKIDIKEFESIEYLVVNGAECEPYLTSDYEMMVEHSDKIIGGVKLVLKTLPNAKAIIGIEDNKPKAIEILSAACKGEDKISVMSLPTKYPEGSDRMLIYATTGKKISPKAHANEHGVVVCNTTTLATAYDAVVFGRPLMKRIFTVTGDDIENPGNFEVYLGTAFSEVCEAAGGTIQDPEKYINGGSMMGFAMYNLDAPITKTASGLVALKKDEVAGVETGPCINCGKCVDVCPIELLPNRMNKHALRGDIEGFLALYGDYCIGCGCCSYVCPAKIPLKQAFKTMNTEIKAIRRKAGVKR